MKNWIFLGMLILSELRNRTAPAQLDLIKISNYAIRKRAVLAVLYLKTRCDGGFIIAYFLK